MTDYGEDEPDAATRAQADHALSTLKFEEVDEPAIELDLSDLPEGDPLGSYAGAFGPGMTDGDDRAEERLERLLESFAGSASIDKAQDLIRWRSLELVKSEGQSRWYNVSGSKLYVVKITIGEDFTYAECSCPNGMHRGGDATCYHSIAARVEAAGLASTWVPNPAPPEVV